MLLYSREHTQSIIKQTVWGSGESRRQQTILQQYTYNRIYNNYKCILYTG